MSNGINLRLTLSMCVLGLILIVVPSVAQPIVYVAPVPLPSDPSYLSYQLNQLGETLRRNQMRSAQVDALFAQADLAREALSQSLKRDELESLVSLAKLLDAAGTPEQKKALQVVIQQKLDQLITPTLRSYPAGTSLVIASPGFSWAARQVADVLGGHPIALDGSLADLQSILSTSPNVVGYVEVEVNVYSAYETVKANCRHRSGNLLWSKVSFWNMGGSPESLAREMVGRLLKKIRGQKCG